VPIDKTDESVSRTLEFAYDDFCVAQIAKAVGKQDDYEMLMQRSRNYKTSMTGCRLHASEKNQMETGSRKRGPLKKTESRFTEGSPWTYLFCEMQDIPGMIFLMGGNEKFAAKVDEKFFRWTLSP
jgi:putative alpha-1,2-mannosidase